MVVTLGSYVAEAQKVVAEQVVLPGGLLARLVWSIRIHGACEGAFECRCADHHRHHHVVALPKLPPRR